MYALLVFIKLMIKSSPSLSKLSQQCTEILKRQVSDFAGEASHKRWSVLELVLLVDQAFIRLEGLVE